MGEQHTAREDVSRILAARGSDVPDRAVDDVLDALAEAGFTVARLEQVGWTGEKAKGAWPVTRSRLTAEDQAVYRIVEDQPAVPVSEEHQ